MRAHLLEQREDSTFVSISDSLSTNRAALIRAAIIAGLTLLAIGNASGADPGAADDISRDGKAIYRFYCYQCHGYSGDARTLASTYLGPKPRDFTAQDPQILDRERMIDAVTNGRPGTGMVRFSVDLNDAEIAAVVDYVRESFMSATPLEEKYHSPENGWVDHGRYAAAFPFVTGTLPLSMPWDELDARQRAGKELYLSACVSCHDQPHSAGGEAIWETRSVSFPRRHFSHREAPLDAVSAASPYAKHDEPAVPEGMTTGQQRGLGLFVVNCAFCHAHDGTGYNWIGSFLEPRPRDLTAADFALWDNPGALRDVIRNGIPNTSMPAWRHVLSDEEIDLIIDYMQVALHAD